jgi:hypothetical protein
MNSSIIDIEKHRTQNEKKISSIDELNPGDHIVIVFSDTDYFHAILVSTEKKQNILEVIFYNNDNFSTNLKELISKNNNGLKNGVQKAKLINNNNKFEIYKVLYKDGCLNADETLKKANKLIDESKYNLFENNDEHFAIYCKTGKAGKLFLVDTTRVKEIFGPSISERVIGSLKSTGTNVLLVNVAQNLATKFPRSLVASTLPAVVKNATPLIGLGMEGYYVGSDINEKYKEAKEGKMTSVKFRKYVAKRVTRSTMGIAGSFGGAVVGQLFIPVPLVGAMVGGLVGGVLGSAAGYAQSILVGEVVESVDNRINKLLAHQPKSEGSVLDNLVLKFDDSVLMPLKVEENVEEKIKNAFTEIQKSELKEKINNEDFDIYLIDSENNENKDGEEISLIIGNSK